MNNTPQVSAKSYLELIKELSPIERFMYWVRERHSIYIKRKAGKPKPWTPDPILQSFYFTNVFRELDKTTIWLRENVRDPLRNDPRVLLATVVFRWFNTIPTGELLLVNGLLHEWNHEQAVDLLLRKWNGGEGDKIFTGAYMIKAGNGPRGCKIPSVCRAISKVNEGQKTVFDACSKEPVRLENVWRALKSFPYLGGFMSYEIVCDLRYTYLLERAVDTQTWANMGPGAKRGLNRILGSPLEAPISQAVWLDNCRMLMERIKKLKLKDAPEVDMRTVEHSLCEYDKMERGLWGNGRLKRRYNGVS